MSAERERILARVQSALAPLPPRASLPEWEPALVSMGAGRETDLWTLFCERLRGVNGTPLASAAELAALLEKNDWRRGYCDPKVWPKLQAVFPVGFTVETTFERERMDDYLFGITAAAGAIAETGTVILTDELCSSRLGALAPWAHVALVPRDRIYPDIPAALAALGEDPNVIWVTGPSKTADVEGILIDGVHGPGMQAALLID